MTGTIAATATPTTIINNVPSFLLLLVSSLLAIALVKALLFRGNGAKQQKRLPPSPPGLPLVGHLLYMLRKPLHRAFTSLARKYGKVLLLRIGSRPVLLVSSASAAESCLIGHDIVFANRPKISVAKIFGFNYTSIGFSPYGPHWRNLRRTVAMEILSTPRLNQLSHIRTEEVALLAKELVAAGCRRGGEFTRAEMRHKFATLTFNIMMRLVMGMKAEKGDPQAEKFIENFEETTVLAGTIFPGDFLPIMKLLDFGRFEKRLMKVREDGNAYLRRIMEERQKTVKLLTKEELEDHEMEIKCLLDSLIAQRAIDPAYYTDGVIFGALSFMLTAGSDTSAITSEWALGLVMNHPEVFRRVREEVDSLKGRGNLVTEKDLPHLPYVQAVVSETLRLYPALPLLIPHETSEDSVIDGYDVPAGTMVFVNVPGIQRDPAIWEEPDKFKPERFLNKPELTSKSGAGGTFLPFGAGRRRCPGEALGMRNVGLTLATLVQCFDWESVDGNEIDMEDESGLSMLKKVPLEVKYRVRDCMIDALA